MTRKGRPPKAFHRLLQCIRRVKAELAQLLGNSLGLETVRRVYRGLPRATFEDAPPPPDFYLRVAERSLAMLQVRHLSSLMCVY